MKGLKEEAMKGERGRDHLRHYEPTATRHKLRANEGMGRERQAVGSSSSQQDKK
jgi:hypothetical protein